MDSFPFALEVYLGDVLVGTLMRFPDRTTSFLFTPNYLDLVDPPILSLGFLTANHTVRATAQLAQRGSVPPFFSNLLPEGDLRHYVAQRAGISKNDEFALLWVTGTDLPGAVSVRDLQGRALPPPAAGGPDDEKAPKSLIRFSLAGVQLKFSAVENAQGGLTFRARGQDGDWIVKMPSLHFPQVPENEYAMLMFAKAVGIAVPDVRLIDLSSITDLPEETANLSGRALLIRRFDRDGPQRIHIEDFNQIFRQVPNDKYDNHTFADIAKVLLRFSGVESLDEFIHRLVFTVAIANSDMHLKNWSVIYRDGRTPTLAPAYDFVCTNTYLQTFDTALRLGTAKRFADVSLDQFEKLAERAGASRRMVRRSAIEMISRIREVWPSAREHAPAFVQRTIDEHLGNLPLFIHAPTHSLEPAARIADEPHEIS